MKKYRESKVSTKEILIIDLTEKIKHEYLRSSASSDDLDLSVKTLKEKFTNYHTELTFFRQREVRTLASSQNDS